MNSICLVIPYFGHFPDYFSLWLKSVGENPSIDFLLLTDNELNEVPQNVNLVHIEFKDLQVYIQNKFDFPIVLKEPYELCKYKPAYGHIFKEYLERYDFWGYCDMDLIFGDLRKFLSDDILKNYDKILSHGHLSLYRNCEEMNYLFTVKRKDCIYYKDVFTTYKIWNNFDEYPYGIARIAKQEHVKTYEELIFADLDMFFFTFRKLASYCENIKDDSEDIIQYFNWVNGKLYNIVINETKKEISELAYVHFQKRSMDCSQLKKINNDFIIVSNEFLSNNQLTEEEILQYCNLEKNDSYCNQMCNRFKNVPNVTLVSKLFSLPRWKRKWFLFKMNKIYKVKSYEFSKGGF